MKHFSAIAAALLTFCLCVSPVSALENANNHPGGPYLYPIVAQPDDKEIGLSHIYSGATFDLPNFGWSRFYSAGRGFNWDRVYASNTAEWENHADEYPDRSTMFPLYTYSFAAESLRSGQSMKSRLNQVIVDYADSPAVGVVLNRKADGTPVGTGIIALPQGATYWTLEKLASFKELEAEGLQPCDNYSRAALLWDDALEKQILEVGIDPNHMSVYSVLIVDYGDGLLFEYDGKEWFMPQHFVNFSEQKKNPLLLEKSPGEKYRSTDSIPMETPSLKSGQIYPISTLADELDRIAKGEWRSLWSDAPRVPANTGKPVIYLYPEKETEVSVKLRFQGDLTYTYPAYGDGWNVTAHSDGRIVNKSDGSEHYYLFWEGISDGDWTFDEGFCVRGTDTEAFLREKLPLLGLTPREYNDFITYWVPKMQGNPYNLIKFADTEYDKLSSLTVTPKPDALARIHMVYKPLEKPVEIPPQTLSGFERKGFTVVEWGGTEAGTKSITK